MIMQPWIGRVGYYQMYGRFSPERTAAVTHDKRIIEPSNTPSRMVAPFPDTNLTQSQRLGAFTGYDKRAVIAAEKGEEMAGADTIQQMKIGGKATVSPLLSGIFPLILLTGIIVLVILKK